MLTLRRASVTSVQERAPTSPQPSPEVARPATETDDVIVVTGSRIRRGTPEEETAFPVTVVEGESLLDRGSVSVGDALNDLPALRSTISTANSGRMIGTAGMNYLDLRGLGTVRTLVLVNGRRHVTSEAEGGTGVDVNMIPAGLIDRVDIVTGGSSAVYGSDAIGGVVNFILKRDFDGIELRAQSGVSSRGDAAAYLVTGTAGRNFADGRGNVAASVEYSRQTDYLLIDRENTRVWRTFVLTDSDPAGLPNGSDGVPDRELFVNVRSPVTLSDGGSFVPGCPTPSNPAANPLTCLPSGEARLFRFRAGGVISEADYGSRDFRPFQAASIGGDAAPLREGQLQPDLERLMGNVLARFELSESLKPYFEAKFARINVHQESTASFDFPYTVRLDNPFLSPDTRAFIAARLPAGTTQFSINRNNPDFGIRGENIERETWRLVTGVEGNFNDDWHYDVSVNYGEFRRRLESLNNRVHQRYFFAVDAVRDATGNIVCRVKVDPSARVPIRASLAPYLAEDVANCVPLNLFGYGSATPEALRYAFTTSHAHGKQTQFVLNGFMTGDLSQLFALPGGPVAFALGAEYRRETARAAYDPLARVGGTELNAIPDFAPPAFEVKEAFAEIHLPLLKELPFASELSADAAVRVADYRGRTGTVVAYNLGATYAPVRDLRLRANYAKSVRAPSLLELYTSPTQDFGRIDDPCDVKFIGGGTSTRAANCAAAGIPANFVNTPAIVNLEQTRTGNPNLREESARSWTLGAVLLPRFLPSLRLSADYYDIVVDDVISQVTAQQVVNSCYDAVSLDNDFCALFQRHPTTHFFVPPLPQTTVNFVALKARGIDVDASYLARLGSAGNLGLRLILTYVIQRDNFTFVNDPTRPDQVLHEIGDPQWGFTAQANWRKDRFSLGYEMRYIGRQLVGTAEEVFTVGGRPPTNADRSDPLWLPAVMYHNVHAGYDIGNVTLFGGVDDVFDRLTPFGNAGTSGNGGIFSNRGRYFYFGAKARF